MSGPSVIAEKWTRDFDPWPAILLAIVIVCSILVIALVGVTIYLGFTEGLPGDPNLRWTLSNFADAFSDPGILMMLVNTLGFCFVSLAVAMLFGLPAAWLIERTDFPGKTVLLTLMTISQIIPGFACGMGWLFLLHPRIGLFNIWAKALFDLTDSPFNILSIAGMGWVQGLHLAPLAFIMTAAVFRALDPALEESARVSGANYWTTLWAVTLRLAWPGILVASIYIFFIGFGAFDIPATIGYVNRIYTFSTYAYSLLMGATGADYLPRYGLAAALSTIVLILSVGLSFWYAMMQRDAHRYAVVTGKAYRMHLVRLGRWSILAWAAAAFYLLMNLVLPLALLAYSSLLPFLAAPSARAFSMMSLANYRALPWDLLKRGIINTGLLTVLTPTIVVALSVAFSWIILRSRVPGRKLFDVISFLPHAVPSMVLSVSALLFALFILQPILPIYGTIWVILLVMVLARLSYGTRMTNSGLIQIHKELEEAAHISGAGFWSTLTSIVLPLLSSTILYAWLWIALLTFRELTLSVILSTAENTTLPVVVWSIWQGGGMGKASAATIVTLALILPIVVCYWAVARRYGRVAT